MKSILTKNFSLILILALAAILRFWQLGYNPPGLYIDEASNGYNAYSILKTGRDEYGNLMPLLFKAFGDYNPALSVYTLVPSIAVFGLNNFAVRFPSALLGTLTVLTTYFLGKFLFSRKIGLISSLLLAISPWHLQFSRYDHEANFMLFFSVLGVTLFFYSKKMPKLLITSAISFAFALNSYHGAKVWIPLILFAIFIFFFNDLLKYGKYLLYAAIILIISTLPYLLNFQKSLIRGESTGILSQNHPLTTFLNGYLSHFSPKFLFISGDSIGRHAVTGMGELYIFELLLVLIGLFIIFRQKTQSSKFLLTWLIFAPIPAALGTPTPHALRSITFLPLWSIFAALGAVQILNFKSKFKYLMVIVILLIASYNIATYFHLYYKHYPKEKALDWTDGYQQMVEYVSAIKDKYDKVFITNYFGQPYIFVLFYSKYDPVKYQPQSMNKSAFNKYEFFGSAPSHMEAGKDLIITPPWQSHPPAVLKEIYSRSGDLVFTISVAQ